MQFVRLEIVSRWEQFVGHPRELDAILPVLGWYGYCRRYHSVVQWHLCIRPVSFEVFVDGATHLLGDILAKFSMLAVVAVAMKGCEKRIN